MLSRRRNSLWLLCLLTVCCQKIDTTVSPSAGDGEGLSAEDVQVVGTGEGTMECPFTVTDVQTLQLAADKPVWVVGYMVGTAYRSMGNAEFNAEARNNSNILLAADSLCSDAEKCIPVELNSSKLKSAYSLPSNPQRLHHCLLLRGVPSTYLHRKGLREVSAGLWMNGFDVAKVAPEPWGIISL